MAQTLEAVRPIELSEIREAQGRIASTVLRTPLVRLELGPGFPDIRLKLENLQPINAYKLRGAANAVARATRARAWLMLQERRACRAPSWRSKPPRLRNWSG
jgi:threonine dehydratase